MRELDLAGLRLVHCGEDWPHDSPPCSREMVKFLERNETLVSWLEPCGGPNDVDRQVLAFLPPSVRGAFTLLFSHTLTPSVQVPALRVRGKFYSISLRMMKSIWRNVRLHKDFVNVEHAPFGGVKLRIPSNLYAEKMRTASKFKVRPLSIWWAHFFFELSSSRCVRSLSGGLFQVQPIGGRRG